MAKINIVFNNKNYSIDESSFAAASSRLQQHLSTTMGGSGAAITLGGISYNVDSEKLSSATNNFVTHLGNVAGSGSKLTVNGVEYSIDPTKLSGAVADLETVLGGLNSDDYETVYEPLNITWDGNTEGLVSVESGYMKYTKVSDLVFTDEQIKLMVATYTNPDGSSKTQAIADIWDESMGITVVPGVDATIASAVLVARKDGAVLGDVTIPEKGLYLLSMFGAYVSSLTTTEPVEQIK